jgi:outer membrane receptor protein involved in Fe transport
MNLMRSDGAQLRPRTCFSLTTGLRLAFSFLTILMLFALQARGQVNTADVLGAANDTTGAALPNAKVTITATATGISRTTLTNATGEYTFTMLQVGSYRLSVEASGFKTFVAGNITLTAGDRVRVNAALQVGASTETVQVEASAVALHTDTAAVGSLIATQDVESLPVDGRNYFTLAQLTPGATISQPFAMGNGKFMLEQRPSSAIDINGQSDVANSNLLDGTDNNERMLGTVGVRPSMDAIQEVKVQTNLYTAESGRTGGGVVDVITKSGTNDLHGSAYEYLRNDFFDAQNYFATPDAKTRLRQHQFGGSLGGPIRKNKSFFFTDYEQFRKMNDYTQTFTVPTLYQEQNIGDFSDQIPGLVLSPSQITTIGKEYFQMFPEPNFDGASYNYVGQGPKTQLSHTYDLRVDHHFSSNDTFFARYSFNDTATTDHSQTLPGKMINSINALDGVVAKQRYQHIGLSYQHLFSTNTLLELKAVYLRAADNILPTQNDTNAAVAFGFPCTATSCIDEEIGDSPGGLPAFSFAGALGGLMNSSSPAPVNIYDNTFPYSGTLTFTRGPHSMKAGLAMIRRQTLMVGDMGGPGAPKKGNFSFNGMYSNGSDGTSTANTGVNAYVLADMLQGKAYSESRGAPLISNHYRSWDLSGYVQDDWRLKPWLTLNIGLRYDIYTPLTEIDGYLSNFDPSIGMLVSPALLGSQHSSKTAGVKTDFSNMAPRFGFSASLGHNAVLRGGYGLFYFPVLYGQGLLLNAPYKYSYNCENPVSSGSSSTACSGEFALADSTGGASVAAGLPVPTYDVTLATDIAKYPGSSITAVDLGYRSAYLEEYSLQLEKDFSGNLVSVGYVGNVGRHQPTSININNFNQITGTYPFASLGNTNISQMVTQATSTYGSMQVAYNRRLRSGLSVNAGYTLAHGLDNSGTRTGFGLGSGIVTCLPGDCLVDNPSSSASPIDVVNWKRYNYGNSDVDIRHRMTATVTYKVPGWKTSSSIVDQFIKGWTLNGIWSWQTGLPFTVGSPRGPDAGAYPNQIADWHTSDPTLSQWFNLAAFHRTVGEVNGVHAYLGNERRNQLVGPRQRSLNVSINRDFTLHESLKLQFRAEGFNISNTANFSNPGANVPGWNEDGTVNTSASGGGGGPGGGPFGAITSTMDSAGNRELQFALKLLF